MIQPRPSSFRSWSKTAAVLALALAASWGQSVRAQSLIYGIGGADAGAGPSATAYSLFSFNSTAPGTTTTIGTVTPTTGFTLQSIAFQPSTGNLYGFQYNSAAQTGQVVTINRGTGALTALGTAFTVGSITGTSGNSATISFNPNNGAIRLVTGTFGNYRINATSGALIAQDASVAYVAGDPNVNNSFQISTLAYNNAGTLYDVDYVNGSLATQNITAGMAAPAGQLTTVGSLGVTPTQGASSTGFTIGLNNAAFLNSSVTTQGGAVRDYLYALNLANGATTQIGLIGNVATFNTVDIAAFVPEPGTWTLLLGGLGLLVWVGVVRRPSARA